MSHAADELLVTHSAVSRHVAKLEHFLGVRLFERKHKHLHLTREGARYATQLKELFDEIEFATQSSFDRGAASATLHINVTPTFATRWLVARLGEFYRRYPGITVQLNQQGNLDPPDFERSNVDIAVSHGDGKWPTFHCCGLFDEILAPVCSPRLTEPLDAVDELERFILLHAQDRLNDWEIWLEAAGATAVNPSSGIRLGDSHLVYQGAIHGLGVAMAQMAFVCEDIKQKRLALLFEQTIRTNSYYAVCPASRSSVPKIEAFLSWLGQEANEFRHANSL